MEPRLLTEFPPSPQGGVPPRPMNNRGYGIPPMHPHSHPYGSNQPVPIIDHVLGESYYVVKTVYFHLPVLNQFNESVTWINENKELVENIASNVDAISEVAEAIPGILTLSDTVRNVANEKLNDINEAKETSLTEIQEAKDNALEGITNAEITSEQNILNVGDDYSTRLQQMAEGLVDGFLLTCHREVEVLAYGAGAETQLALPHGINYIVGTNQLRITCNGVVWYEGYQYEELGRKFSRSNSVNLLINVNPGDQICAWVVPLKGTYDQDTETFEPDESTVCNQVTWVNEELVPASTEITIPEGFKYIAGKKHLCVSLNGIVLAQNIDYLEIGEFKQEAYKLSFNFPLKVGDVLNVWTVPYNIGESQQVQDNILQLKNDIQYLKDSLIDESKILDRIAILDNKVEQIILDGNSFKGAVTLTKGLPVAGYHKGDQYSVAEAGTYAGQVCEVGDLIICVRDFNEETFSDSDWNVLQANIESINPATDEQIDAIIEGLI